MEEVSVFAIDWHSLLVPKLPLIDVVLRSVLVFVILHAGVRVLGRKNLQHAASYNIVTLFLVGAFGGRAVLGEDTSLTACGLGLIVVLALNALTSRAVYHSRWLASVLEGPVVRQLIREGVLQQQAMRQTHCSEDMLRAQLRGKGETELDRVWHAFMERTGEITFIMKPSA